MRINSEGSFRFENIKTQEAYELDEYEMEEFTKNLHSIHSINTIEERSNLPASDVSEEREKEYFTE